MLDVAPSGGNARLWCDRCGRRLARGEALLVTDGEWRDPVTGTTHRTCLCPDCMSVGAGEASPNEPGEVARRLRAVQFADDGSHANLSRIMCAITNRMPARGWVREACEELRDELVRLVVRPTATRRVVSHGEYGSCSCGACDWEIEPYDAYCKGCGARLTATEYRHAGDGQ